jgi:hypothetical protein
MSGWQSSGLPMFDYLLAPWPRYFSVEDLILNVLGYIPFGLALAVSLPARWRARPRVAITALLAAALSFTLETTQGFLPSRIASNIDIGSNFIGALLGALLGAHCKDTLFGPQSGLSRLRARCLVDGYGGDTGTILVGIWLFAQLTPDHLLFADGDLLHLFGIAPPLPFRANRLIALEAAQTACMVLGFGLFVRCLLRIDAPLIVAALLLLGIAARSLATGLFFVPSAPLAWSTPGANHGLLIGSALLALAFFLPRVIQHSLAGASLLGATVLINLLPENPYLRDSGHMILERGNFPNFYGLTNLVSGLWPFVTLAWLIVLGMRCGDQIAIPRTRP